MNTLDNLLEKLNLKLVVTISCILIILSIFSYEMVFKRPQTLDFKIVPSSPIVLEYGSTSLSLDDLESHLYFIGFSKDQIEDYEILYDSSNQVIGINERFSELKLHENDQNQSFSSYSDLLSTSSIRREFLNGNESNNYTPLERLTGELKIKLDDNIIVSGLFYYYVLDSTYPTIEGPETIEFEIGSAKDIDLSLYFTSNDIVDGNLPITITGFWDHSKIGQYNLLATSHDKHGNNTSHPFFINIIDSQAEYIDYVTEEESYIPDFNFETLPEDSSQQDTSVDDQSEITDLDEQNTEQPDQTEETESDISDQSDS